MRHKNARCDIKNARCEIKNARCEIKNARCEINKCEMRLVADSSNPLSFMN